MNVSNHSKLIRAWRNELQDWCDEQSVSIQDADESEPNDREMVIEMPLDREAVAGLRSLLDALRVDQCLVVSESGPYDEPCYFWAELTGPCGTVVVGFGEQLDWYLDELASWIPESAYAELRNFAYAQRIHDRETHSRLAEATTRIFLESITHAPEEVYAFVPLAAERAASEVEEDLPLLHLSSYVDRADDVARMILRDFPGLAKVSKDERRDLVFVALRAADAECVDSYGLVQPVIDAVERQVG